MKTLVFLLLFIQSLPLYAQEAKKRIDLSAIVLSLAKAITKNTCENNEVIDLLKTIDSFQIKKINDSCYYFHSLNPSTADKEVPRIVLRTPKKNNHTYYEISILRLNSNYTIEKDKSIIYNAANDYNISYPTLSSKIGIPIIPRIQAKETKLIYYKYCNPLTGRMAIIRISSSDGASASYNIIYRISIFNGELE